MVQPGTGAGQRLILHFDDAPDILATLAAEK
jgi:hypothetical protein